MDIDKYITDIDDPTRKKDILATTALVEKMKKEDELTRKKDILATAAIVEGLKSYVGENITAIQIRKMSKEKVEYYFLLYQEKLGQETTNEMMSSLIEITVKGISYVTDIDDKEELANDLKNNKQLRRTVGRQAAKITEKYGDVVTFFRVMFDVGKHISFSSTPPGNTSTPPDNTSTPPDGTSAEGLVNFC